MTKISHTDRAVIRNAAEAKGCKYRITARGEVHFYGDMPNTNQTGWYFVAWSVAEAVKTLSK